MIEVTDQNVHAVTLCEAATQTRVIEQASVAVTAKPSTPPALLECGSQTLTVQYQDSGTQMSPPIKEAIVTVTAEILLPLKPESADGSDAEQPLEKPSYPNIP